MKKRKLAGGFNNGIINMKLRLKRGIDKLLTEIFGKVSKKENRIMEEQKKLYIGNLEYGVTDESLKSFIEEKGLTVKEVKIIMDKYSGRSKGFGFAEFDTEDQAQAAIDALNEQDLNGRKLTVNKARKMQPRKDNFGGGGSSSGGGRNQGFGGGGRY
ncbi:MAG: hypothetical protein ABIH08_03155 [Candidatus Omnitrophota bacterium]